MNAKISVFVICVEAIIYLLLCNLHDCTFNNVARLKAKIPTQLFFYKYSQVLKNSFFIEHLHWRLLHNQYKVLALLKIVKFLYSA